MVTRRTAPRKTDAERGPLGAWAYNTRTLLGGSPVDAAAAAGITYPTLRKIEGGSTLVPSRRSVYDLWQYLRRLGREQGIPVEDPPEEWRVPGPAGLSPSAGDLVAAIGTLVAALEADREERRALTRAIAALAGSLAMTPEVGELLTQLALRETTG